MPVSIVTGHFNQPMCRVWNTAIKCELFLCDRQEKGIPQIEIGKTLY